MNGNRGLGCCLRTLFYCLTSFLSYAEYFFSSVFQAMTEFFPCLQVFSAGEAK